MQNPVFDYDLILSYDKPGPRYTSYPTAPHFTPAFGVAELRRHMAAGNAAADTTFRRRC